jgi:anti-sigma regulatory factor (Ser/Thr protein kinase)
MATYRRPTGVAQEQSLEAAQHPCTTTTFADPLPLSATTVMPRSEDSPLELSEFLAPVPEAVPTARHHVTGVLTEWGFSTLTETAGLLTCELVSNAVKHGSPAGTYQCGCKQQIVLTLRRRGGLFIEVWDPGAKGLHPHLRIAAPHDEVGRGLQLVDTLSRAWGHYSPVYGGTTVWCEMVPPRGHAGGNRHRCR